MRTWGVDALTACNPPLHYKNRVNLMKFRASANPSFPKLTWVADVHQSGGLVTLLHGRAVEVRPDFFIEGVWNGPFEKCEFADSECVF